jgi:hypothetical protein
VAIVMPTISRTSSVITNPRNTRTGQRTAIPVAWQVSRVRQDRPKAEGPATCLTEPVPNNCAPIGFRKDPCRAKMRRDQDTNGHRPPAGRKIARKSAITKNSQGWHAGCHREFVIVAVTVMGGLESHSKSWSAVGSHGRCRPADGRLGDTLARGFFRKSQRLGESTGDAEPFPFAEKQRTRHREHRGHRERILPQTGTDEHRQNKVCVCPWLSVASLCLGSVSSVARLLFQFVGFRIAFTIRQSQRP